MDEKENNSNDYNTIDKCNIMDDLKEFYCQKDREYKEKYIKILIIIVFFFIATIILGSIIFMFMFELTWIDALYAASLILTGIDIEVVPTTNAQKIFIIFYALLTVLILLSMANLAVQYFFHLFDY
jgi:hypothetical protein